MKYICWSFKTHTIVGVNALYPRHSHGGKVGWFDIIMTGPSLDGNYIFSFASCTMESQLHKKSPYLCPTQGPL